MPRLLKNPEAVRLLCSKCSNWELTREESRKGARQSHPTFLQYTLSSIRACYERPRTELILSSGKLFAALLISNASYFTILMLFSPITIAVILLTENQDELALSTRVSGIGP